VGPTVILSKKSSPQKGNFALKTSKRSFEDNQTVLFEVLLISFLAVSIRELE
jgi:hypothetical protein